MQKINKRFRSTKEANAFMEQYMRVEKNVYFDLDISFITCGHGAYVSIHIKGKRSPLKRRSF